jgi:hypothetical protein
MLFYIKENGYTIVKELKRTAQVWSKLFQINSKFLKKIIREKEAEILSTLEDKHLYLTCVFWTIIRAGPELHCYLGDKEKLKDVICQISVL